MKKLFLLGLLVIWSIFWLVYAHPGNTDDYWCHTCYTNCSSYGLSYWEYHCHNKKTISYSAYAPEWSCKTEQGQMDIIKDDIKAYEEEAEQVKNDIKAKYKDSAINWDVLDAIAAEKVNELGLYGKILL